MLPFFIFVYYFSKICYNSLMDIKTQYYNSPLQDLRNNKQYVSWNATIIKSAVEKHKLLNGPAVKLFTEILGKPDFMYSEDKTRHNVWRYDYKDLTFFITSTKYLTYYETVYHGSADAFKDNKIVGRTSVAFIEEILERLEDA